MTRTLALDVYDPTHTLNMDSDSPKGGTVYADRFLRVTVTVEAPNLSGPASVIVFTGPLIKFQRDGVTVSLEAQGKEQRARTDVPVLVCKKRMYVVDAIEKIMRQRCGETKFSLPSNVADYGKLTKDVIVGRDERVWPWPVVQRLAASQGLQAFYNGPGTFVLRETPEGTLHEFVPTGPVSKSHDWSEVYNRVEVRYSRRLKGEGKKKDKTIKGRVTLDLGDIKGGHPFAPGRMGRNGVPWTRTLFIEDDKINTRAEAAKIARKHLDRMTRQHLTMSGQVVPAWHLDPLDPVKLDGDRFEFGTASASFEGEMSIGYHLTSKKPKR